MVGLTVQCLHWLFSMARAGAVLVLGELVWSLDLVWTGETNRTAKTKGLQGMNRADYLPESLHSRVGSSGEAPGASAYTITSPQYLHMLR